jgi:hypothetical protein
MGLNGSSTTLPRGIPQVATGLTIHESEGPEDAVPGHDRLVTAQDRRAVEPTEQQRVKPAEQPGKGSALRYFASGQVNQTTGALLHVCARCAQSTARVVEGDAGPLGQVPFIRRAMSGEKPSGQLGQVAVAVGQPGWIAQPVAGQNETLIDTDDRPADCQTLDGRKRQDVDESLPGYGHIGCRHDLTQLCAGHRAVSGKRSLDGGHTSISLIG